MYLIRRVYKIKPGPGNVRKAASLLQQMGSKYEDSGQRDTVRVYWSGYTVPGPPNTVYMDWVQEKIESPYREGNESPSMGDLGSQLREVQDDSYIEFYEMQRPQE
jgi:hypothetical protein